MSEIGTSSPERQTDEELRVSLLHKLITVLNRTRGIKLGEMSQQSSDETKKEQLNEAYLEYTNANMDLFGLTGGSKEEAGPDTLRNKLVSTLNKRARVLSLSKDDKEFKKNGKLMKEITNELNLTNKSLLALNGDEQYIEDLREAVAWSARNALENASKQIFPKQKHNFGKNWLTRLFGSDFRLVLGNIKEKLKNIRKGGKTANTNTLNDISRTPSFVRYFVPEIKSNFSNGSPKSRTLVGLETNLEIHEYEKWKNPKQDYNGERYVQAVYNAKNRLATIEQNIKSWIS